MLHLGDITKIDGHTAPRVNVIIGGSPCQDLSIAGKRAGLSGKRSVLFLDQIRIIKEMREEDARAGRSAEFIRPRFMVWENVPGTFSAHKGEDFRCVLEETARVVDKTAVIPRPPKGKWRNSGCIMGDGWSIAWRVLDAQFWGVPQRRRRIALVADFGGQSAPEILFERESVSGNTTQSGAQGQETARDTCGSAESADKGCGVKCVTPWDYQSKRVYDPDGAFCTLSARGNSGQDCSAVICMATQQGGAEIRTDDKAPTLTAAAGMSGNNQPVICIQGNCIDRADTAGCNGKGWTEDVSYTLNTVDRPAVAYSFKSKMGAKAHGIGFEEERAPTLAAGQFDASVVYLIGRAAFNQGKNAKYDFEISDSGINSTLVNRGPSAVAYRFIRWIVRRLTPLECERLQGFPDGWTDIGDWRDSKGKLHKASDSARYKALGNSIALPPWTWVCQRLSALCGEDKTMASLFDGIGGFPLIWERINGKGSCIWASEIEEFCMAVTREHLT